MTIEQFSRRAIREIVEKRLPNVPVSVENLRKIESLSAGHHIQVFGDLLHLYFPALVGEHRISCDYDQTRHLRQIGDQIVGHAIGEIFLLLVVGKVGEGEDGDGGIGGVGN